MKRILPYLIFLAVCFLSAYPLFHNLDKLTLRMWDESRIAVNAFEMKHNGNYIVPYYEDKPDMWNTKPLLLTWSIVASTKLFGDNEFGIRFPSALCAFLLTIFLYLFFRFYLQDTLGAVVAALSLITFYGYIEYHVARNGDFDSMLTTFTFMCTTSLFIGFFRRSNQWLVLASVFMVLGFLTKGIAAGIVLPGAFLYFVASKNGFKELFKSRIIVFTAAAIVFSFLYYLLRESVNPGFLANVVSNEITGRYLNAAEGHQQPFIFYVKSLYDRGIDGWFTIFIVCIFLGFINTNQRIRSFHLYTILILLVFLSIHSLSSTKLPWYIAPVYPHIAVVIGIGLSSLIQKIQSALLKNYSQNYVLLAISIPLLIFYFKYPYKNIGNTSVRARKEQTYPELFFGDKIKDYLQRSNSSKNISIAHEDYNSSLEYYVRKFRADDFTLSKKHFKASFEQGEIVLACEKNVIDHFTNEYQIEYIINEQNYWVFKILKQNTIQISDQLLRESAVALESKMKEIASIPDWNSSIREKAKKNNTPFEEQLRLDAIWVLENDKKISSDVANHLRAKK